MIGLGANLGDPIQQIVDARSELVALDSTVSARFSSLYLSSPVGDTDQANFINCVLELTTTISAFDLLDAMQGIENRLGRVRHLDNQNAPRLIDIDMILYGESTIDGPRLSVPHPRMTERLFVLVPLLELAPDLVLDNLGNLADWVAHQSNFDGQTIHRLSC